MLKKTCFLCGAKVTQLVDSMCENCLKQERPPIQEVKPVSFKICNMSKKIKYKNAFHQQDEIEKMLPDIMKKQIVIDEAYELTNLDIKNFEVDGHKLLFDIEVDCNIK